MGHRSVSVSREGRRMTRWRIPPEVSDFMRGALVVGAIVGLAVVIIKALGT